MNKTVSLGAISAIFMIRILVTCCTIVKNLWFKIEEWLLMEYNIIFVIVIRDVLFGHDHNQDENVVNVESLCSQKVYCTL